MVAWSPEEWRAYYRARNTTPHARAYKRAYHREYKPKRYREDPDFRALELARQRAIYHTPRPEQCFACGCREHVQRHHEDHFKYPLVVIPLCRDCNFKRDWKQDPDHEFNARIIAEHQRLVGLLRQPKLL